MPGRAGCAAQAGGAECVPDKHEPAQEDPARGWHFGLGDPHPRHARAAKAHLHLAFCFEESELLEHVGSSGSARRGEPLDMRDESMPDRLRRGPRTTSSMGGAAPSSHFRVLTSHSGAATTCDSWKCFRSAAFVWELPAGLNLRSF
jgi:hypothetical protein